MQRKRFAIGLFGGLLLGLLVVFSFSYASAGVTGFYSAADLAPVRGGATNVSTSTTLSTTTGGTPAYVTGSNSTTASSVTSSPTSAQNTPSSGAVFFSDLFSSQSASHQYSSLNSLAAQPAVLDGIVILPIIFALVLGLLLRRVSARRIGKD